MTCSIPKSFVIHHGYLGCEINYYYNYKKSNSGDLLNL